MSLVQKRGIIWECTDLGETNKGAAAFVGNTRERAGRRACGENTKENSLSQRANTALIATTANANSPPRKFGLSVIPPLKAPCTP